MGEDQIKEALSKMQKDYGVLVVNYNNQKAELAELLKHIEKKERELERAEAMGTEGMKGAWGV